MQAQHQRLQALSPLDGRYKDQLQALSDIFSEKALMQARVKVEIHWLIALCKEPNIKALPTLSNKQIEYLKNIHQTFSLEDAATCLQIESKTQHDVKAIEYFIKEKLKQSKDLDHLSSFVHFACTSEDINNLAYGILLKKALDDVIIPCQDQLIETLIKQAETYADTTMLARTHGQAATATTFGKEIALFANRLKQQKNQLLHASIFGKFNGAVGNYNAHHLAYPKINWPSFSQHFVETLGLEFQAMSSQIEPRDGLANVCHNLSRSMNIIIDLARDMWSYTALGYLKQTVDPGQVGSSTMPHKVNPIAFENAEGNAGLAIAMLNFLAQKLPVSRWQRDLSDSTVMRNLGPCLAYTLLAFQGCSKGLNKCQPHNAVIQDDLNKHWEILTEAIQTLLRQAGQLNAYETLKTLSQNKIINQASLQDWIKDQAFPNTLKEKMLALTPQSYVGLASNLARSVKDAP
jgi:adenylosuccinate lyase